MEPVYALTLQSLHQDMNRLDHVATNLVNTATPGYRREVVALRAFYQLVEGAEMGSMGTTSAPPQSGAAVEVRTDPRPGSLRMTGRALDVAITGDGFFEVRTENGVAYTRQGDFRLDAQGRLVTASGYAVLGRDGEILLKTQTPTIDTDGRITAPDGGLDTLGVLGEIRVVRFEHPENLQRLGNGLMAAPEAAQALDGSHGQLRQGALENSNVSSAREMVALMQTMRHLESMQKVIQGYDEMLGTAIRKIGELA